MYEKYYQLKWEEKLHYNKIKKVEYSNYKLKITIKIYNKKK